MSPPRVVLDTSVLIPTLVFQSSILAWLRSAWRSRLIVPLVSEETTDELVTVLQYPKFNLTTGKIAGVLADYLPWCEMVTVSNPPDVSFCPDPKDWPFLQLALVGQADALISRDGKHLLSLAGDFPVPILTGEGFRQMAQQ